MSDDPKLIDKVLALVLEEAAQARNNAAYSGSMSDGGARLTEELVRFYRLGQQGVLPADWSKHVTEVTRREDPEYATYQRLKAKFKE